MTDFGGPQAITSDMKVCYNWNGGGRTDNMSAIVILQPKASVMKAHEFGFSKMQSAL